ncbi:PREDICTED: uncharacterized protein K02A2.6-like [Priapulus caudatus]|uniref:RNA-directed DNA polymerase n=1 Tax=Priapulus caudatus TaxID=37621 RepID=A0ABM1EWY0_PRICU|nr:PREDICTED: uncharacterized protein K02A2.6-like [Priapulus caudatus]
MCFGIAASPAQFQRCMDSLIGQLPGVAAYLDDLIITGRTEAEHWKNLENLLNRLQEFGFRIRLEKCEFFKKSVEYLGHEIGSNGMTPSKSSIKAVEQLPRPKTCQEIQAFMGKINYYGRFIADLSEKARPLYALMRKNAKFEWKQAQEEAFQLLKREVIDATQLTHYDDSKPLILATDASQHGIGAVLLQLDKGVEYSIVHASKTLNEHQVKYSQIEKEALSIVYGVTKFRQFLYGRRFSLKTDHKPLVAIFSPDKNIPVLAAQRLQRWAITLMSYQYDICYKPSAQHGNADGLSRLPMGPDVSFDKQEEEENIEIAHAIMDELESSPLKAQDVKVELHKDSRLKQVKRHIEDGSWPGKLKADQTHLRPFWNHRDSLFIFNDIVLLQRDNCTRIVVPFSLRKKVLDLLHTAHWGVVRMKQMARRYVWWPGISQDIEKLVKCCEPCRLSAKLPNKTFQEWPKTEKPWQRVHLDFAGPYKGKMWLVCIDAHSKFPYVAMLNIGKTTSEDTIDVLKQIFTIEGSPDTIVTDNGPQFVSREFEKFCVQLGIHHVTSPPYHPASNGEAERFVQSLKTGLDKNCAGGAGLKDAIRVFLATYRCSPHPGLAGKSPAEVLHGRQPRNLLSLLWPREASGEDHTLNKGKHRYDVDALVYARNYARGPKWVPGTVIKTLGRVLVRVQTDHGVWKRHVNQLQPRMSSYDVQPQCGEGEVNPTQREILPEPEPVVGRPQPRERRYPERVRRRPDFYRS